MEEDPTEHVHEHIIHEATHGGHDEHGEHGEHHAAPGRHVSHASRWITAAALTAALLAALAAVSSDLATSHLTESTLTRIKANDDWSYYQAKSIKSSILDGKMYWAELSRTPPRKEDQKERAKYELQMPQIQKEATELEALSDEHLETHEHYEGAETLFHIAIAIVAIAVVAKRKEFWYVSIVAGAVGVVLFGIAFAKAPATPKKEEPPATAKAPEHPAKPPPKHAAGEAGAAAPAPTVPGAPGDAPPQAKPAANSDE